MNRLYCSFLLFFAVSIAIGQTEVTEGEAILASLDSLRSEIKKTYDNGNKERVYYYDSNNNFIRAINFSNIGKVSSVYYLEKGVKQEFLKFDIKTGKRNRHTYYHPNKKNAVDIFYDNFASVESVYFYDSQGTKLFEVIWDRVNGGFSKRIFDSDGDVIKKISHKNKMRYISYVYNGKPHGWITSIDKDGNEKKEGFMHKGSPGEFYEGWEQIIIDFDKIPELEKQLDAELKKYGIVLDDSLGKGIKVIIKEN